MSWSRQYSSADQLENDTALPMNATREQFDKAKAAAKLLLDSGIIPIADKDPGHEKHADNTEGTPQAQVRISLGGHSGHVPSIFVSVSGV